MNVEDFRLLYDYNAWANHRIMGACAPLTPEQFTRDLGSSFRSVRDTLAHIVGGEWIWLERWHGRSHPALPSGADFPDFESLRARFIEVDRNLVDYAASLTADDLQRVVPMKTTAGVPYAMPLWQMLQHVANHSTYHRGQITNQLRQLGAKTVSTDLIFYHRELAAKAGA